MTELEQLIEDQKRDMLGFDDNSKQYLYYEITGLELSNLHNYSNEDGISGIFGYTDEQFLTIKSQIHTELNKLVNTKLTEHQRRLVNLYFSDYTQHEIATQLGCSQGAVHKGLFGNLVYKSDGSIIHYGGAIKKLFNLINTNKLLLRIIKQIIPYYKAPRSSPIPANKVHDIRTKYHNGHSIEDLARSYSVSTNVISLILSDDESRHIRRRRQPHQATKQSIKASEMKWLICFPDGHTETIINVNDFARRYRLNSHHLRQRGFSKGYGCERLQPQRMSKVPDHIKQEIIDLYTTKKFTQQQLADKYHLNITTIRKFTADIDFDAFKPKQEIRDKYNTGNYSLKELSQEYHFSIATIWRWVQQ